MKCTAAGDCSSEADAMPALAMASISESTAGKVPAAKSAPAADAAPAEPSAAEKIQAWITCYSDHGAGKEAG